MEKTQFQQLISTISKGLVAFAFLLLSSISLAIRPMNYGIMNFDYSEKDIEIVMFLTGVFFLVWAFFPLDRHSNNHNE